MQRQKNEEETQVPSLPPCEEATPPMKIVRGLSRAQARRLVRSLPGLLRDPDSRVSRAFVAHFAHSMFDDIHRAFLEKSTGRPDDTGDRWAPLDPRTIAQRPPQPKSPSGRGLLSREENARWRGIFASTYARLAPRIGDAAAKQRAASLAWAILKASGARTKLATLGNRKVPILMVSGKLERSLAPGSLVHDRYYPRPNQVLGYDGKAITMGTSLEYAAHVHRKRRLWPPMPRMQPWINRAVARAAEAIARLI